MRENVPRFAVLFFVLSVCASAQSVSINEFMPRPLTGEAEWIELCNISGIPLNLLNWTIEDRTGKRISLGESPPILSPGAYLVLTQQVPLGTSWELPADSLLLIPSFPSLNNSGDEIILRDGEGRIADSISYTSSWVGDAGVSIERIDVRGADTRENWTLCIADSGATPGRSNSSSGETPGSIEAGQLLINEIMYEPLSTGCEWVEIFHNGEDSIALSRIELLVSAGSGFDVHRLLSNAGILAPGRYAVITADSSLFTRFSYLDTDTAETRICVLDRNGLGLGNAGDRILLRERGGVILDSADYEPDWHHPFIAESKGISLERLHPDMSVSSGEAWSSSTDPFGATPGRRNSVYASGWKETAASTPALTVTPIPFSPDGDGYEDFCTISCMAPASIHQARLRIYDIKGRLVRTLLNNAPLAARLDVVWDGLDEDGNRVRIGPYVALLDILDTANNAVAAAKGIVVVAVRL